MEEKVRWWPFEPEEDRAAKQAHAKLNEYFRIAQKETAEYLRTLDLSTLDRAATAWLRVLGHVSFPSATQGRLPAINNASGIFMYRYDARGDVEDLNRALFWWEEAVKEMPRNSPDLPGYLNNLGYGLLARFKRTAQDVDLERGVQQLRQAVQATPPHSPDLSDYLNNLGNALRLSYKRFGLEADLEEAIAVYQKAVVGTPPDSLDLSNHLNNLGTAWHDRYDRTGRPADLEEAIRLYRQSLQVPRSSSSDIATHVSNLASGLREQYARTGRVQDLEEATRVCEQAVNATPPDSPDLPVYLNGLWGCLCYQFERTGRVEDLEGAMRIIRKALHVTPSDSIRLPALLSNLGTNLQDSFERTKRMADLEESIQVFEKAIRATPLNSPDLPTYLGNLGNSLLACFGETRRPADLDKAIDLFKQAAQAMPPDSPAMPALRANLGNGLRTRFARTKQVAELEDAIQAYRQAITSVPPDSVLLPAYLNSLATGLGERFALTGREADLQEAIGAYRRACQLGASGDPQVVLGAARNWGHSAFQRKEWEEAAEAYGYALATGRQLLTRQLLREHKESWLRDLQEMSGALSYAFAKMGRYEDASVVMERGRARLLGQALTCRRDLENLAACGRADLLQRYREIEQELERLIQSESPRMSRATETGQARLRNIEVATRASERLIEEIRQVPNYKDFLSEASFAQIETVAADTPVVYLLATSAGGLGLLVHAGKVQPIWLDSLTSVVVNEWLKGPADDPALGGWLGAYQKWLVKRTVQAQEAWFDAIDSVTRQLGRHVVEPLTEAVHKLKQHGSCSVAPSVTLVPAGLLALLPLHAAWIEDASAPTKRRYFIDECTVTYAPSASILGQLRENIGHSSSDRLLAVEEPLAANASRLPNVHREIAAIAGLFDDPVILAHKEATREAVLSALPKADVVHFSCHGRNNWESPLDSGLLLADDASRKGVMLTVRDMLDSELPNGRLATLSACETGIVGTEIPDEVVALPGALLQAGFCGVVASLWSVSDISTAMLMQRFYAAWRSDNLSPAEALQFAQRWLRDSSNKEKAEYFKRNSGEFAEKSCAPETEATTFFTNAMSTHMDRREFAHPFWWAAFYMTGS